MPCFLYVLSPLQESARVVHALFSLCTVTIAGIGPSSSCPVLYTYCDCCRNQPECGAVGSAEGACGRHWPGCEESPIRWTGTWFLSAFLLGVVVLLVCCRMRSSVLVWKECVGICVQCGVKDWETVDLWDFGSLFVSVFAAFPSH